ncbi:MAG: peptidase M50 [Brevundimonas sp.]|nr:MAG: peptidase M50 [Brevundimonas sp.]
MSDTDTPRRPGPWDARPEDVVASPAPQEPERPAPAVRGQSPTSALISTLVLGVVVYLLTGSLVMVVALLFGILVHEAGHALAMNRLGMGPARIYILPILGATVGQRPAKSEWHDVLVSLAGPAFGLLAAIPFIGLFLWTRQAIWLDATFVIAFLNLVNLAPAPPLDGSRALGPVLAMIHPMVERVAMIVIGVLAVFWGASNGMWLFAIFLGIALIGTLKSGLWRPKARKLTGGEAARSVGLYLLTAAACMAVGLAAILPGVENMAEGVAHGARFFGIG